MKRIFFSTCKKCPPLLCPRSVVINLDLLLLLLLCVPPQSTERRKKVYDLRLSSSRPPIRESWAYGGDPDANPASLAPKKVENGKTMTNVEGGQWRRWLGFAVNEKGIQLINRSREHVCSDFTTPHEKPSNLSHIILSSSSFRPRRIRCASHYVWEAHSSISVQVLCPFTSSILSPFSRACLASLHGVGHAQSTPYDALCFCRCVFPLQIQFMQAYRGPSPC
ncbi:hypothetical protein BDN70DRAFT_490581 [Pholiota conissans]|uniref:Uncharacterized protein n=1 Tax=Pholiota conissans TaxID=109636 RepID=A0A9P5YNT9_9AGAR|nr:hypothetical protein BDN70DRAFT_490581 [Pholiota conissans]